MSQGKKRSLHLTHKVQVVVVCVEGREKGQPTMTDTAMMMEGSSTCHKKKQTKRQKEKITAVKNLRIRK